MYFWRKYAAQEAAALPEAYNYCKVHICDVSGSHFVFLTQLSPGL